MPARKTTAKKTVAKKSVPKQPVKRTTTKKTAEPAKKPSTNEELAEKIATQIEAGALDAGIIRLEEAISNRVNKHARDQRAAARKVAASASSEKKLPAAAPKKDAPVPAAKKSPTRKLVEPVDGGTYKLADRIKGVGGAKVKFIRFKPQDTNKAVVEMLSDVPGKPKGSQVVIPVAALEEVPKSRKPVQRKK